jgi:signal transduction histidine kinase
VLLILAMAVITMGTTLVSLLAIRRPMRNLIVQNLSSDLLHSLATFESMQAQQMTALDRENALLADLPSLKALMTTNDERTIADGGVEFWKVSGNDLFALADRDGNVMAAYVEGAPADPAFRTDLSRFLSARNASYLVSAKGLYGCSVQPLYFGGRPNGTLLGYVISGFAVDRRAVEGLSRASQVEAVFLSGDRILANSLTSADKAGMTQAWASIPAGAAGTIPVDFGGERFLAVSHDLSAKATASLKLVEFESLEPEERAIRKIDQLVLLAGLLALLLGAALMAALSRSVTLPLEQLAAGVRAFASGDSSHILPYRGTREVRELSAAFARMRREILQINQALLESERLAMIGRMASSVSHDLRHYLAAVYANSEFLASDGLPAADRIEVLAEIRTAVDGTTEMLESLLMFSRTGAAVRRTQQDVAVLAEWALNLVRNHPDAAGVTLTLRPDNPAAIEAYVDAKQVERAIYNLLLNGCQAPRGPGVDAKVSVSILASEKEVLIDVFDNGEGVPSNIRDTLFDPFVSEGKHKGSGLGLTLTQSIATEHGGSVTLVSSLQGETVFCFSISRGNLGLDSPVGSRAQVGER